MNQRGGSSWLDAADRAGRAVETGLLAIVLSAMVLLATWQIVVRNLGGIGFPWADEALRVMVLWVAVLGAIAASRDQRHVSIDALSRLVPARISRQFRRLSAMFAAVVSSVLAWYSYVFVQESLAAGDAVFGGAFPAWAVQAILPVGFAMIAYRYAIHSLIPSVDASAKPAAH